MTSHDIEPLGWKGYYERFAAPLLSRDRFFLALILVLLIAALEAFALATLVPLHTSVPYVIRVNGQGRIVSRGEVIAENKPVKAEVAYWLARFVRDLYEVSPSTATTNVTQAFYMVRGGATAQLETFFKTHNPVRQAQKKTNNKVTVTIKTIVQLPHHEAYIAAQLRNIGNGTQKNVAVTVSYEFLPPTTVSKAIHNPIGLQVTNFVEGN